MGSPLFPVSVKGVALVRGGVILLENERREWELPGGRLDATDATLQDALRREFVEELGIVVEVGALLDSWIYDVEGKRVLILTYSCQATRPAELVWSDEHEGVAELTLATLRNEPLPEGYLHAIERHLESSMHPTATAITPSSRRPL